MQRKMLIDAAHAEETRVVVLDGSRIEDFDFETQSRKQLRGNIYLAKVVRVEPSLQSAFVEYGGNRHGFLSFNEIHPDYYQIPIADREALLREEAEDNERHASNGHGHAPSARDRHGEDDAGGDDAGSGALEGGAHEDDDDVLEEERSRRLRRLMRRYKIQEVIKRRQIMLVQVVKEERGNKGAALTTYLSLAGRYGVLMPNTARGGGISRKITAVTDRKRLKTVVNGLDVPDGMGLIIRTAGAKRTKAEIKRDYEYLLRLWENIRDVTLKSVAPALIYEEEDLVKRAIRDMFDKDLDGILVEGEEGYREAKDFMRMIMPSQAKKIQVWREPTPLFVKHRVEEQLASIHSPVVALKSGGYLVINQTEALVAVDVNSGRATRERNIETTALKTNLEAAAEAARQLRLRDLAGLVVIDFIDMEESKNNRAVEKVLKDALKDDRARIQMGKISAFGLMEISRQRRRTGLLEGTTHVCPNCAGLGRVRSAESSALSTLRAVEAESAKNGGGAVTVRVPTACGLYLLNDKRAYLARVEASHGLAITVIIDDGLGQGEHAIERTATSDLPRPVDLMAQAPIYEPGEAEDEAYEGETAEDEDEDDSVEVVTRARGDDDDEGEGETRAADERGERSRRGGRRRRGRGRSGREDEGVRVSESQDDAPLGVASEDADGGDVGSVESEEARGRRRGRRGGRRGREETRTDDVYGWVRPRAADAADPYVWNDPLAVRAANDAQPGEAAVPASDDAAAMQTVAVAEGAGEGRTRRRPRRRRGRGEAPLEAEGFEPETVAHSIEEAPVVLTLEASDFAAPPQDDTTVEEASVLMDSPATTDTESTALDVDLFAATPEPANEAGEPVLAPEFQEASVPAEPDPSEITAPPEAPKRGWWRRRL